MEMDQVYTELILEHNQDKRNKRLLDVFTASEHGHNPSCGDEITLQLDIEDGIIKDASYVGVGCAISQASTSLMIDLVKGKTLEEAKELCETFLEAQQRAHLFILPKVFVSCLTKVSNIYFYDKVSKISWFDVS